MKRILHNSKPRSPLGIGLFLVGALLVALSAWQGFAALSQPTRDAASARPVALSGARFELRSIETIRPGEQVLAFDPETVEQAWKPVEHALVRATDHLRILTIREAGGSQQTIKTTDEHPFWVPDEGWTDAGELRPGHGLLLIDGQPADILATRREEHPNLVTVHNLTVAGLHTYHVSADSHSRAIVVHNAKCDDLAKAGAKTLEAGKDAAGKMLNKADDAADAAKNVRKRPGTRGHPDHQSDVNGPGRAQAEAQARPGETVLTEQPIQGHAGVNRRADNQVVGVDGKTRVAVESERRPNGSYHKDRTKELQGVGIDVQTRPIPKKPK